MRSDTDVIWEEWGKRNPYYGVLTQEQYDRDRIARSKDEFFASGEDHVSRTIGEIEKHFGPMSKNNALDFGCGVGRILIPLSRRFTSVTGMDISVSMLKEAVRNIQERGINNIELLHSDDDLSPLRRRFDFIHTYIVLQHIAPRRGYRIIRNLFQHLSPGGAFLIHVCVQRKLPFLSEFRYRIRHQLPYAFMLRNLIRGRGLLEPTIHMNEYNVTVLLNIFRLAGFDELVTKLEDHGSFLTASFYSKDVRNLASG